MEWNILSWFFFLFKEVSEESPMEGEFQQVSVQGLVGKEHPG